MMSPRISLKSLTEPQRKVWLMRYRKRWLQRAHGRAGAPVGRMKVIGTKPRTVRLYLLSEVFERY